MEIEIYKGKDLADNLTIFGVPAIYNNYTITPTHAIYSFDYINIANNNKLKKVVKMLSIFMREKIDIVEIEGGHFGLRFERAEREFVDWHFANSYNTANTISLGKDTSGNINTLHLDKAPHILVAGATGSGKSVFMNNAILGFATKNTPESLGMVLIDPKQVEFAPYENLPHLTRPIINDIVTTINALNDLVYEMDKRYSILKSKGLRDNSSNVFCKIVVFVDELADLMLTNKAAIETPLVKLAQKGRACGIHLILATQRPTVNVVTGLLKANIPTRIAFSMSSMRDSMVMLDYKGANELLGKGDCLVKLADRIDTIRIQAPFVTDEIVHKITKDLKPRVWNTYNKQTQKPTIKAVEDIKEIINNFKRKFRKVKNIFKNYSIDELNDYDSFED